MKAVLCRAFGKPETLTLEDVEDARPGPGEVLIDVVACALNFPDVLLVAGLYQHHPPFPFSPGLEVAGTVSGLGEGAVGFQPGDRVLALPMVGGLAEKLAVPASRVLPVPRGMDLVHASAFAVTYGTSYHALKQRANLASGETLLVLGAAGGVGRAAVEIGKAMGARVIAAASTPEKLDVAREAGADELVNYGESPEDSTRGTFKDTIKKLTDGHGADVIYDPVGGDLFDRCTRAINWKGRLLVVGFASGQISKFPVNLALLKGCQVVGVFWGEFTRREPEAAARNFEEILRLLEVGKLRPLVSEVFPLTRAAEALDQLARRRARGKVVVQVREDAREERPGRTPRE